MCETLCSSAPHPVALGREAGEEQAVAAGEEGQGRKEKAPPSGAPPLPPLPFAGGQGCGGRGSGGGRNQRRGAGADTKFSSEIPRGGLRERTLKAPKAKAKAGKKKPVPEDDDDSDEPV